MKFITIFLSFLILFSYQANACSCVLSTPEISKQELEKAFYVGKVTISSVEEMENNYLKLVLQATQPYKEHFYGQIMAVSSLSMCGFGDVTLGGEYEMVIYKDKTYGYRVKGSCPFIRAEIFDEYREKGKKMRKEMNKKRYLCEQENGEWKKHGFMTIPTCISSSSDSSRSCENSSECEGECLADYTEEQMDFIVLADQPFNLKVDGICSKWKSKHGCHHIVQNGYVQNIICTK